MQNAKCKIVFALILFAGCATAPHAPDLERLPPTGAWIIGLPMKIGAGSGGPLRAVALLPR
jgi:kynurenine formamidase